MSSYADMAKKAQKDGAAETIDVRYVNIKSLNGPLVGRLMDAFDVESNVGNAPYKHYLMETDDGMVKFHLGGAADKEYASRLVIGEVYSITFLEKTDIGGGKTVNRFTIAHIPDIE